jgi:hypothetical protein
LEGAEGYDFFRQPEWLKNPLLAGSYAVYKKETLAGEGTGKLCHIHRPEIIDARGRRVWGDLSIAGDTLCISIPEGWLSEARYPVIVDPVVGTATVGSQTLWDADPGEPWVPLYNEYSIPVNRFLVNETINGACTAYFYCYSDEEPESGGWPVLYSEGGNKPLIRQSVQEPFIDLRVKAGNPSGWRNGVFRSNGSISGGSYIWFGLSTDVYWYARFDYGGSFCCAWREDDPIPPAYPLGNRYTVPNIKLSMYFEYTSAQNHVRTLSQGVTLADRQRIAGGYTRALATAVHVHDYAGKFLNRLRVIRHEAAVFDGAGHWNEE